MKNPLKRKPQTKTFTESIQQVKHLKNAVATTQCPSCNQLTLSVLKTEWGKEGYETEVKCGNCSFYGVSNNFGYQYKNLNFKEKPTK